jgi:DNA (cytosine-5)-methyltransferase 1
MTCNKRPRLDFDNNTLICGPTIWKRICLSDMYIRNQVRIKAQIPSPSPSPGQGPTRYVSLFCGIGAFDLVLQDMKMKCVLACDNDETCKDIYFKNHGITPWHDDIHTLSSLPPHDVLVAGPPCQPFSQAGKRLGLNDLQNGGGFPAVLRLIEAMPVRPGTVVLENVMGLKTIAKGTVLDGIVCRLRKLAYDVQVKEVRADQYGAPMLRTRLFIVCHLAKAKSKSLDLPPPTMKNSSLRSIIEPMDRVKSDWLSKGKYVILAREKTNPKNNKIFCGYKKNQTLHGRPGNVGSYSQGVCIYSVDGITESFTTKKYMVYFKGKGVRFLTEREMFSCMGFDASFKIHQDPNVARRHCANSINIFALRPLLTWALRT